MAVLLPFALLPFALCHEDERTWRARRPARMQVERSAYGLFMRRPMTCVIGLAVKQKMLERSRRPCVFVTGSGDPLGLPGSARSALSAQSWGYKYGNVSISTSCPLVVLCLNDHEYMLRIEYTCRSTRCPRTLYPCHLSLLCHFRLYHHRQLLANTTSSCIWRCSDLQGICLLAARVMYTVPQRRAS